MSDVIIKEDQLESEKDNTVGIKELTNLQSEENVNHGLKFAKEDIIAQKETKEFSLLVQFFINTQKLDVIGEKSTDSVKEDSAQVISKTAPNSTNAISQTEEEDILEKKFVQQTTEVVYGELMV